MIQSLMVKLGMLAFTLGVVFWIGWQAPQLREKSGASVVGDVPSSVAAPATAASDNAAAGRVMASSQPARRTQAAYGVQANTSRQQQALDLNRASAADLEQLPGIGAVLAQRMITYRQSHGGFQTVEELRQVKGIGRKKLDRVRPLVTVAVPGGKGKMEKHPS